MANETQNNEKPTVDAAALTATLTDEQKATLLAALGVGNIPATGDAATEKVEIKTVQKARFDSSAEDINDSDAQYGVIAKLLLAGRIERVIGDRVIKSGKRKGQLEPYDFVSVGCVVKTCENGRYVERQHQVAFTPEAYQTIAEGSVIGDTVRVSGTLTRPAEGDPDYYVVPARGGLPAYVRGRLINAEPYELIPGPFHAHGRKLTPFESLRVRDNRVDKKAEEAKKAEGGEAVSI